MQPVFLISNLMIQKLTLWTHNDVIMKNLLGGNMRLMRKCAAFVYALEICGKNTYTPFKTIISFILKICHIAKNCVLCSLQVK